MERKPEITIDDRDFSWLERFIKTLGRAIFGPDHQDTGNLDWLNDILAWTRGEEMTSYTLVWLNFEESRQRLGHAETVRQMEKRNVRRFPFGSVKVVSDIEETRRGEGPTVFDWIIELSSATASMSGCEWGIKVTPNPSLHRARPRSLFPVAHRFLLSHTGVAAEPVSVIVRQRLSPTGLRCRKLFC